MGPKIVISILTWDSIAYTRNLLANLEWAVPGTDTRIMILDQGSEEETRNLLRTYVPAHPNMIATLLTGNIGYSAGHNYNFRKALETGPFDYFITVNSDVLFGDNNWANQMAEAMECNPRAGLGGPLAFKSVDQRFITDASRAEMRNGDFYFITGAICIIRTATAMQCGLFDEIYTPAYAEDTDMAMRYLYFGWQQLYIEMSVIHGYLGEKHKVSAIKMDQLKQKYGDFKRRNADVFYRRWNNKSPLYQEKSPLEWGDTLYIPGRSS